MITIMGATGNIGAKLAEILLEKGEKIKVSQVIVEAIKVSGVKVVVNLSSFGAEHSAGTGPIKGLHLHEKRMNQIDGIQLLHLRPSYFMENLLMNIPFIQKDSIMGGAIQGQVAIPMIATADIAEKAAEALIHPNFQTKSVQVLFGPDDVTMETAAAVVSQKLGRKILYLTFDGPSTKSALIGLGLSADTADQFVEMSEAFNSGFLSNKNSKEPIQRTSTSLKAFIEGNFPQL